MGKRTVAFGTYWLIAFTLIPTQVAWAYIDPATTTYIIQIAVAVVITLGVSLGIFLYKLQMIVTNVKVSIHGLTRRIGRKQREADKAGKQASPEKDASLTNMDEREALAAGSLDFAIPVRETYSAIGTYAPIVAEMEAVSAKARKRSFVDRLKAVGHWLWDDDRKFRTRFSASLLIAAAVSMTFIIFSMLDSVILNESELNFSYTDVVEPILILGLQAFSLIAIVLTLFRGRVFDFLVCSVLSLLICGYLQSTYFNAGVGKLIGLPLGWEELGVSNVVLNLLMWVAIVALIFYLGFVRKPMMRSLYRQLTLLVPASLLAIQLVALLSIIPADHDDYAYPLVEEQENEEVVQTLTTDHIYEVSSGKNIIVFIVDMMDEEFINDIAIETPGFFNSLDGFTRFTNNVTRYNETFPSVVYMLTGVPYDPKTTSDTFMDIAYKEGSFVTDIRAKGFTSDLYMDKWYTYTDKTPLAQFADNADTPTYEVDVPVVLEQMANLSLLKSVPLALKDRYSINPETFSLASAAVKTRGAKPYAADDFKFYEMLKKQGLNVVDNEAAEGEEGEAKNGRFAFYHLNGSHYPWHMDADARYSKEETTGVEQTKGCFKILNEYFKQMKDLGIYKDATIIITGDHPTHVSWMALERPMLTGLFVKPSGSERTPLQMSDAPVTYDNLRATCVEAAGGDPTPWGKTYFEVTKTDNQTRDYYNHFTDSNGDKKEYIAHYRIKGDARVWDNWRLVEVKPYNPR